MVQDLNNLVLSISTLPRLPFTMSHEHIALVCGLRHALDQLLHKIASNPFHLSSLTSEEQAVVSTVSRLVSQRTAGAGTAKWNPARSSLPGPSHSSPHWSGRVIVAGSEIDNGSLLAVLLQSLSPHTNSILSPVVRGYLPLSAVCPATHSILMDIRWLILLTNILILKSSLWKEFYIWIQRTESISERLTTGGVVYIIEEWQQGRALSISNMVLIDYNCPWECGAQEYSLVQANDDLCWVPIFRFRPAKERVTMAGGNEWVSPEVC